MIPQSLYLDGAALHSNLDPYRLFRTTKEITVQDIPDLKYKLELFVGSEPIELQRTDNRTWAPVQRPYALRFIKTYTC